MQFESSRKSRSIAAARRHPVALMMALSLITGTAYAADEESAEGVEPADSRFNEIPDIEINTSRWKCKFCPDNADEPWLLEIETGAGYVSNDSFKFGEYNGLDEEGLLLVLNVDAQYRDDESNYFDFTAENLGLDSGRIDLEGGTQGEYRVNLVLDQIYRNDLDTALTPYSGSTSQVLPGSWVAGSSTSAMTTLESDSDVIEFSTRRRILKLDSRIIGTRKWSYDFRVERQTKDGEIPFGAAIGTTFADTRSAILAKPIDYVTDRLELAANYRDNDLSGSFTFVLSTFKNDNSALGWENAFSIGSNTGQLALEPDNQMRQISASGQYRGFENVILNGSLIYSQYTQDENFLPYTVNSVIATTPLPQTSLDGKVDIARAIVSALWMPNPKSRVKLTYEYFEHVDDTDRATYAYVIADNAISGTPQTNFAYDFRTQKLKAEASRRLEQGKKIAGGLEYGRYDRSYQEVDQSTETRVWAKYAKRTSTNVNYSVEINGTTREADNYEVLSELIPPENPQLRKYNLADRDSIGASFNVDFITNDRWFVNINLDHSSADYSDSSVGLTDSEDLAIGFDLQFMLNDEISLTGYLNRAEISSSQDGSSVAGDPDWTAESEDRVETIGLGLSYAPIEESFRLGVEYMHTDAIGEIDFHDATATALPDLESDLDNIEIYAEFDYSEKLAYRASYIYEVYEEKNWNLDEVTPGTIDNVLNLGEESPDYKIGVLWLSLKYRF